MGGANENMSIHHDAQQANTSNQQPAACNCFTMDHAKLINDCDYRVERKSKFIWVAICNMSLLPPGNCSAGCTIVLWNIFTHRRVLKCWTIKYSISKPYYLIWFHFSLSCWGKCSFYWCYQYRCCNHYYICNSYYNTDITNNNIRYNNIYPKSKQ